MAISVDIEANLKTYLAQRSPRDRYASFDYCFNYFRSFSPDARAHELSTRSQLQESCLQLGFYLASWGMFRGGTVLLERSVRYLVPVVEACSRAPRAIWDVDADAYTIPATTLILEVADSLRRSIPDGMSDTLVTKIMLGVFGCVPAFDQNVTRGLRSGGVGNGVLSHATLAKIGAFYREHAKMIERYRVPTLDFVTGSPTAIRYTRAKVIDMIFFVEGAGKAGAPS